MAKKDISHEIYLKYFNRDGKLIRVTLKDGEQIEGIFAGFFHPDDQSEYIYKWHFIPKKQIEEFSQAISEDEKEELGVMIWQKDIEKVEYV